MWILCSVLGCPVLGRIYLTRLTCGTKPFFSSKFIQYRIYIQSNERECYKSNVSRSISPKIKMLISVGDLVEVQSLI